MSFRTIVAFILEALLLVMTMGTEIKEFLIAAVCLGGLLVLSFISAVSAMLILRFSVSLYKPVCERGKTARFQMKLMGPLILPVVCSITLHTPFIEPKKATVPIFGKLALTVFKSQQSFDFSVNCPHSGNWRVGIKKIKVCDIFGFFKLPILFTPKAAYTDKISVTPQFHPQNSLKENSGRLDHYSGLAFGNSELGETFEDNRGYLQGDPLRRINWKQSVKLGKLITKLYEKPRKAEIIIAIDYYTLETRGEGDDIYREAALFISEYFAGQKNNVTVCLLRPENSEIKFVCEDVSNLSELALNLANLSFKKNVSPLTDIPLNDIDFYDADHAFIITSNPHNSLITEIEIMNRQGLYVSAIIPKATASAQFFDCPHLTFINSSKEISQKVGAVLC